ncbi:DUF397 domain-containing protein [Streptomyces sp. NPDC019531]|uniref:DUF397 domain-containing protein n=1 Tax=Streptomyces sp. NPDC019531 TaxID=3365062 RepID=UPI00384CD2F0
MPKLKIAPLPTRIAVRDSKAPTRATLSFPTASFAALVEHLKEHPWSDARISG